MAREPIEDRSGASRWEWAVVVSSAFLLAVILLWPLAGQLSTAGRIDTGDGRFSIWNVAWVAHAITTDPRNLYNANIFFPHDNTLAFSEANIVAGVIAIPAWLVTQHPLAASNWTILCSFVLSFLAMYALGRRLTGSPAGAAFAAVHFAYAPFVLAHVPHVQLLMTFGLPLILMALDAFVQAPTASRALRLGGVMALQGLACGYYGIFGGLMAGFGVLWFGLATTRWRQWQYWALALGAGFVAMMLIAPFYLPYIGIQEEGFQRTIDDARTYSAGWRSYLVSPLWIHRWMVNWVRQTGMWSDVLFPGFLPIGFAVFGLAAAFSGRSWSCMRGGRATVGFYVSLAALSIWASLGPDGGLYTVLHRTMPFFSMMRAPARFGVLVVMALAIVGAVGFRTLLQSCTGRRYRILAVLVLFLSVVGSSVGGLWLAELPTIPVAYQRLTNVPPGPVAEFPFWVSGSNRHRHTEYMLWSTFHWQPLINGYSDHIPPEMFADMQRLATFPSGDAWRVLDDRRARYVVIHWRLMDEVAQQAFSDALQPYLSRLRLVVEQEGIALYEVLGRSS
jgi:hypothetical protein